MPKGVTKKAGPCCRGRYEMTRKNPESRPLRIVKTSEMYSPNYGPMLVQLAVAESNLIRAGKDSAMPHFLAIIKELERYYGFHFEQIRDGET